MDKPTHMYDILGKRQPGVVKAVVAAQFENVSQTFDKLCSKISLLVQVVPDTHEHCQLLDDIFARLTTWGHETGAENQTLDYKLRKSKDLRETVFATLQELQVSLDEALQLLDDEQLQQWSSKAGEGPGDALVAPLAALVRDGGDSSRDDLSQVGEPDTFGDQTSDLLENIRDAADFIEERVSDLVMLGPSLEHPYPQDLDTFSSSLTSTSDASDQFDIEQAKREFPSASSILHSRMGRANWKRRIAQIVAQDQIKRDGKVHTARKGPKKAHRHDVAQDAFNFQKPTLKFERRPPGLRPAMFLPLMSAAASSAAVSDTASSLFDVDYTNPRLARADSATTLATLATIHSSKYHMHGSTMLQQPPAKETVYPKPPLSLTEISRGQTQLFTCDFCGYDLEAGGNIRTEEDWHQHILNDLEPYLCTFDKCFSAQETYAQRDEWYRHELESHRIKKTWPCPACMEEFETKKEATDHLMRVHCRDLHDTREIEMMKAMLRQTLSGQKLGTQICPLCGDKVEASACKVHISQHLEYFALLSLARDESSEEDDSDELGDGRSSFDDAMSERGRKEFVLNTFVTEQFKLNLERGMKPPDLSMEGGKGLEPVDDMSDYDGSKDSESRAGSRRGESKQMLMDRMFRGGSADGSLGRGAAVGRKRLSQVGAGPPSQASSSEKLPLLRTWSSPRNSDFMGRDKELANLYKILSEPGRVSVISGEGGMGKTALAVEFTWRFEQTYHYIFWIQAETPVGSSDTFSQIALKLNLAPQGSDQDTLVRVGREFLEQIKDKRWLMVLDNVNRWEDIDNYLPIKTSATQGSVLITTRHESLTAPSRPVNYFRIMLPELSVEEGRKLLIHGLPEELRPEEMSLRDPEYKVAGEIAGLVGLPLLIVYISGYIKKSGCTLSEFWEYWNEWRSSSRLGTNSPGAETGSDTNGREGVLYMAIRDLSSDEMELLKIMAFFDSDGIQREALEWNDPDKPGPSYLRRNRLRLIISKLKGQSIVTEKKFGDREIYYVHRLLQSKLLQDMNSNRVERDRIFTTAFDLIRNRLPRPSLDTPEQARWMAFKEYLPHVLSLQRAYADPLSIVTVKPFLGLAELFKDGGVLLWQRYIHGDALKLLRSAEKVLDQLPQHDENLRSEVNITINLLLQYFGISYRKEIKERSAKILEYREALIEEKRPAETVTRDDKLILNNARADYANTLLQFNDYERAESIYESCLTTYTEIGDAEDSGTAFAIAKLHHHLAYCKMYEKKFDEALQLSEKAVRIIGTVSDMAMTLRYQFDMACIMLQSGNLQQALDMHQDILKARLGFQGRASYFTLQSQYAVAAICHYLGRLEDAELLMRSALSKAAGRGGRNFWPEAAVARTKYHLAMVMAELAQQDVPAGDEEEQAQRKDEARKLAIEAKDVLSRMLPYDPEPITGVREEDTLALFDHLQPVFGGRFTGIKLLGYVSKV